MNILQKDRPIQAEDLREGSVLVIDKPLTWTSFDVVNKVRYAIKHALQVKKIKVGHAGTLDPLATGVLVLCTGKMTKQIDSIMAEDKVYSGRIKLGCTTPSYDGETAEDFVSNVMHLQEPDIHQAARTFIGDIQQFPPVFSAIKKDGQKMYDLARKGVEVKMDSRPVQIQEFEITSINLPYVDFRVVCSKGTYIRSLAHDLGAYLKVGAYLTTLRRDASGVYRVEDAWDLELLIEAIRGCEGAVGSGSTGVKPD